MAKWRVAAGVAILALLAGLAAMLAPSYYRNLRLEQSLEQMVFAGDLAARSDAAIQTEVVERAAVLGIPLRPTQVHVDRTGGSFRMEARYVVRVDLPVYTVDLHFRAGSGAR